MSDETKYSPEPWRFVDDGKWPGGFSVWTGIGIRIFEASEADARRMVACVNACAGIPTSALESGALAKVLVQLMAVQSFASAVASDSLRDPDTWALHRGMAGVMRDRCYETLVALGRLKP